MRIDARYLSFSLAVIGFTLFSSGTAQCTTIVNGGFDNNSAGWVVFPVDGINNAWRATGGNPGGNQRLNSSGLPTSDPYIQQTVTGLSIGATYLVSWNLLRDFGAVVGVPSFGVFLDPTDSGPSPNGSILFLFTFSGTTGWLDLQTSFVATATSHTLRFAGELDPRTPGVPSVTDASYWIDNVSMVQQSGGGGEIPEPSTLLLMSGGVLVLWLRRRSPAR